MTTSTSAIEPLRREPLVPVHHPLVAVADRARRDERRVGTGARLGHGKGAADLAGEQRFEPLRSLVLAPGRLDADRDELGVARIGGVVAEGDRAIGALAEDLVHEAELDLAETASAELGRQVRRPEPLAPHLVLEWRQERASAGFQLSVKVSSGKSSSRTKARIQASLLLELRLGLEVPGHGDSPSSPASGARPP